MPESIPSYFLSETRHQNLLRTGRGKPLFLQGVLPFAGRGVFDLSPLNDSLTHIVSKGMVCEVPYFRAGNMSDDILYLTLSIDSKPVRYFPIAPKGDIHVPLAIVELYPAGTRIDVCLAAPRGLTGTVVVDVGLIESPAE